MANVLCIVVNPTAAEYTDIGGTTIDVPAYSSSGPITLTDAQLNTLTAAKTNVLIQVLSSLTLTASIIEINRKAVKIAKLGVFPGTYAP